MNKDSRIFVTGHRGLVGSNVVSLLKERGYTNILIAEDLNLEHEIDVDYFFYKEKPEYVIHCAAKVGGIKANAEDQYGFLYHNLLIQNNIINCCRTNEIKKCIFLGSSCIYSILDKELLSEEDLLTGPLEETNMGYSLAKIVGLKLCEFSNKQYPDSCKFISLMPCNLIGKGATFDLNKSHVFNALIKKIVDAKEQNIPTVEIWGSGNPKREFMNVRDLADGILWALNNIERTDTFLNIGTGIDISIKELAERIKREVGYKGKLIFNTSKPDGIMKKCMDVSKINSLGWSAKILLNESIKEVIDEYKRKMVSESR